MRALVIGADGFAGRWLLRHLIEEGDDVVAAVGPSFASPLPGGIAPILLDVRDRHRLLGVVRRARAHAIYYLAGVSALAERSDIELVRQVTVQGTITTLTAALEQRRRPRVLVVGSSHVYGFPALDHPIRETEPLAPSTVYGAMKAAAEVAALGLAAATGLEVIAARPFNHIGPGQKPAFVAAALAGQVARIRASGRPGSIRVGSLDVQRDFTDVRDVVRAYRLLVANGQAGESYNIASGQPTSIRYLLDELMAIAGIGAEVVVHESHRRKGEPPELTGDSAKIRAEVGWIPMISLHASLADLLLSIEEEPPALHPSQAHPPNI